MCPRCNSNIETINHLFLHCYWEARLNINWLDCTIKFPYLFTVLTSLRHHPKTLTKFIFLLWSIWKEINNVIFSQNEFSFLRCYFNAKHLFKEWDYRLHLDFIQSSSYPTNQHSSPSVLPTISPTIMVR